MPEKVEAVECDCVGQEFKAYLDESGRTVIEVPKECQQLVADSAAKEVVVKAVKVARE